MIGTGLRKRQFNDMNGLFIARMQLAWDFFDPIQSLIYKKPVTLHQSQNAKI